MMYSSTQKSPAEFSTWIELLQYRAQYQPEKTAYIFLKDGETEEATLTYRELDEQARCVAARLQSSGITEGERALLLYPPSLDYIAAFFGCLYAGAIAVPVYPPHPAKPERTMPRLKGIVRDAQPSASLTISPILKMVESSFSEDADFGKMHWSATDNMDTAIASDWQKPSVRSDTLAFLQYTSGSTGNPKGVMVTHGNLLYNEKMLQAVFKLTEDSKIVSWLPLYHDMGLIGNALYAVYIGTPCILMSPASFLQKPYRWLRAISGYGATFSGGPNFAFELCCRKISPEKQERLDLSSWKAAFNGSEPLRADTIRQFSACFEPWGFRQETHYPCYGMAETTLIASGGSREALPVFRRFDKEALEKNRALAKENGREVTELVGCGKTICEQQIVIANPDTLRQCREEEVGEIWVSGDNVAKGYWQKTEASKQAFEAYLANTEEGPFLRTGDLGFFQKGELFITGRLKDVVIIRGRNHYPQDIELTAEQSYKRLRPGCSAAFSVDVNGNERLVVAAEVERRYRKGRNKSEQEKIRQEQERWAHRRKYHVLPEHIPSDSGPLDVEMAAQSVREAVGKVHELEVYAVLLLKTGSIPKTSSGKIQRHACKTGFLNGSLDVVGSSIVEIPKEKTETCEEAFLPAQRESLSEERHISLESKIQTLLSDVFADLLIGKRVGIRDNFFDLGGDSLRLVRFQNRLQEVLGRDIRAAILFKYPTIASLVRHLRQERKEKYDPAPTLARARKRTNGMAQDTAVAIIGMAGRFPGAGNLDEFWQNLRDGKESVSFFTDEELIARGVDHALLKDSDYVRAGGVLENTEMFDAAFFGLSPRDAELTDPQHRLFLECAWETFESAGYDTETYPGRVGVYAGAATNTYLLRNLAQNPGFLQSVDDFQLVIGNEKDYLATRVAYHLNLKGPVVSVATACSTSLVAVQTACQSLLSHQCDMALAGGVSVKTDQDKGYLYRKGGIPSPDGHCRAFDATAGGTVLNSSGMGIVLLKRLEDALADGDPIHAVISGAAVNNDGSAKVGFTAPGVDGQTEVIAEAQALANADPESVTYVETHGTGTLLGDPVEIMALTQAFRSGTSAKGFCAIGSLKTNIGHLDAASGVAGLLKTVLAMKHRLIPPTLNFERPNPEINFENSPFYVNTGLSEWKAKPGHPRRAGVSSFGIGGTNAHVVLEEAPPMKTSGKSRPLSLMLLSAKTPAALDTATRNLRDHMKRHPDLDIADIAYTLQVGRKSFEMRRMLVCKDTEDAARLLDPPDPKRLLSGSCDGNQEPSVVFMFSGQGAQYAGMGQELYQTELVFREQVNICSELLRPHLGLDLREVMYPQQKGECSGQAADITQTVLAQTSLFVTEYALARLMMAWGIHPQAMIGHSIGEYVAACLAGVFSLEDALSLVAARGTMMQDLPSGAMLAVSLSEKATENMLSEGLSLAAVNGPELCTASGTSEKIDELQQQLAAQKVTCRRLHTSHAFHSEMTEPIVRPFVEQVRQIRLNPPEIPYLSNVTGQWITAKEATDPEYWATHLRHTVRFEQGLRLLLNTPGQILLEIGPGRALSTFALRHPGRSPEQVVLTSLRHPRDKQSDVGYLLTTIGKLWLVGLRPDWTGFYRHEQRNRLSLPTYPFERQRYWIEPPAKSQPGFVRHQVGESKPLGMADLFYIPSWKRLPLQPASALNDSLSWLVFTDECGLGDALIKQLEQRGQQVIAVEKGDEFSRQNKTAYTLNPDQKADYSVLLDELRSQDKMPEKIVHLWSLTSSSDISKLSLLTSHLKTAYCGLIFLVQAIGRGSRSGSLELTIVSNNMQDVTGKDLRCPEKAILLGPVRVIPHEYPNIRCRNIDVDIPGSDAIIDRELPDQLLTELITESVAPAVAYRGNYRWEQTFEPVRLAEPADKQSEPLRKNGVYLITGGLEGIGLQLAEYLARTVQAKLVLPDPLVLPPRDTWEQWLSANPQTGKYEPATGIRLDIDTEAGFIRERETLLEKGLGIRDISFYEGLEATLDKLCASYIYDYFRHGGVNTDKGQVYGLSELKDRLGILPKFSKFYEFFIRVLSEEAIIRVEDEKAVFLKAADEVGNSEQLYQKTTENYPDFKEMLHFFKYCVSNYTEALSGKIEAISVLFPEGRSDLMENFAETTIEDHTNSKVYKNLLREVISKGLENTPGKLRILEAGAGTGQLTEVLIPALKNKDVEYYFTDIGKSFLIKAERDAADRCLSFMNFGMLDISDDPVRQGYDSHSFDMIFALNVVHATKHIGKTLAQLKKLLAPNGMIVLIEVVKTRRLLNMLWGLAEGWWYFEDKDIREGSPLLTLDKWEEAFQHQGFKRVKTYPEGKKRRLETDFGMIFAQEGEGIIGSDERSEISGNAWKEKQSIRSKIEALKNLESLGAEVMPVCADITKQEDIQPVVSQACEKFGEIHGFIHAAGAEHKDAIQISDPNAVSFGSNAKIKGALAINTFFKNVSLDFRLFCSSLDAIKGRFGQLATCSANAFLDAFVHLDASENTLAVNWEEWKDGRIPEGVLSRILFQNLSNQLLVWPSDSRKASDEYSPHITDQTKSDVTSEPTHPRPPLGNEYVAPNNETEQMLADIWQEVLGIRGIGIYDSFFELGGDSLLATQVISRLRKTFHIELTPDTLFEKNTVAGLSEVILQKKLEQEDPQEMARLLETLEQMPEEDARKLLKVK